MRADSGPIGGDLSYEFHVLAETGESGVFLHADLLNKPIPSIDTDFRGDLSPIFNDWTSLFAATDEMTDEAGFKAAVPADKQLMARGIEVGHIFYFGTKYSEPMKATVTGPDGKEVVVHMGSYGIGPTRLVPAIIEASHDDAGIVWPVSVAPFEAVVINLKVGDAATDAACEKLYAELTAAGVDVLYDDRDAPRRTEVRERRSHRHPVPGDRRAARSQGGQRRDQAPQGRRARDAAARRRRRPARRADRAATAGPRVTAIAQPAATAERPPEAQAPGPFSRFEFLVAGRYLRARRKDAFISVIAALTLTGIAIGVATLIVVMSVMNGFREELLGKILGLNGHFTAFPIEQQFTDYKDVVADLETVDGVRYAVAFVEGQALASGQTESTGVTVRGIDLADIKKLELLYTGNMLGGWEGWDESARRGNRFASCQQTGRDHRRPGYHRQPERHADAVWLDAADPFLPGQGHLRPRHGRVRQLLSLHAARVRRRPTSRCSRTG